MTTLQVRSHLLLVLCLAAPTALIAQPDRIAGTIDGGPRFVVRGIVHPLVQPRYDQGPVEASFRLSYIQMTLTQSAVQRLALDQLLIAQQDPASRDYHNWLTPEQYADRFGVSRNDLAKIALWLTSAGFSIEYTARGRNWIAFSGTAAQVEAAFHTAVHRYLVGGEMHYAVSAEPQIPAALDELVGTLLGLNDFNPKPLINRAANTSASGSGHTLAPGDIATIYNINPLYQQGIDGSGQRLVIVGETDVDLTDIQTFRSSYGLSAANIQTVLYGADPGVNQPALREADLDLEWGGAIARNATLIYVYGTNADVASMYAIDQNLAPIISESFASCEAHVPASYASSLERSAKQGNSQGITWLAGSGDSGAAGCDADTAVIASHGLAVGFPASVPEITAVGGTEFNEGRANYWSATNGANGGSAVGYIPEIAWNDTLYGTAYGTVYGSAYAYLNATGGGASVLFAKPSWQSGPGVPLDGQRDLPDVALAGSIIHDYYDTITAGQPSSGGGTSAATPVFAGILTLLNQYLNGSGLGNVNVSLYSLAVSSPAIFHDISAGNNMVPCEPGTPSCINDEFGFSATSGYDLTTGLGSVDAYNLATGWNGPSSGGVTVLSLSPPSIVAGGAAFMLTVNGSNFAPAAAVRWNNTTLPSTFI